MDEKENRGDRCIKLGIKTDETYLRTILNKLFKYDSIYIKIFPYPDKFAKVAEYYSMLREFGVEEVRQREKIQEIDKYDSKKFVDVVLIKWEIVPKLKMHRESLRKGER